MATLIFIGDSKRHGATVCQVKVRACKKVGDVFTIATQAVMSRAE